VSPITDQALLRDTSFVKDGGIESKKLEAPRFDVPCVIDAVTATLAVASIKSRRIVAADLQSNLGTLMVHKKIIRRKSNYPAWIRTRTKRTKIK
jgi:hypothetical protein